MLVERFQIREGQIWYKDVNLGSVDTIYVDSNELVGVEIGITRRPMPLRIDGIMAAGDKVIGIESKKPDDLLGSFMVRRLKRQLRTLLTTTDIPVLLIRGEISDIVTYDRAGRKIVWDRAALTPLFEELARWQMLGAVVLHGPEESAAVPPFLNSMRKILGGGRNVLVAISGTDQHQETETKPGWLLRRIPGWGGKTSTKLHEAFGSTLKVFTASDKALKEEGVNTRQLKGLRDGLK